MSISPIAHLITPQALAQQYPLDATARTTIQQFRSQIQAILSGQERRLVVVIGPCSIHDVTAALAYAEQLNRLRLRYQQSLLIVMRTYFEKPRTVTGWKGLINDPHFDGSTQINQGLQLTRQLLLHINQLGLPTATEFLDCLISRYLYDLITWGAIGARTSESQQHREMASALPCPIGFKNNTAGNLQVAIDAIRAAREPQSLLTQDEQGAIALHRSSGNLFSHLVLRGGQQPNYQTSAVAMACEQLRAFQLPERLMIDCSHGNSQKDYRRQLMVVHDLCQQIRAGSLAIAGIMVESFLVAGNQPASTLSPLTYGQSITDPCLGWQDSERLLAALAQAVESRFSRG